MNELFCLFILIATITDDGQGVWTCLIEWQLLITAFFPAIVTSSSWLNPYCLHSSFPSPPLAIEQPLSVPLIHAAVGAGVVVQEHMHDYIRSLPPYYMSLYPDITDVPLDKVLLFGIFFR